MLSIVRAVRKIGKEPPFELLFSASGSGSGAGGVTTDMSEPLKLKVLLPEAKACVVKQFLFVSVTTKVSPKYQSAFQLSPGAKLA